MMRARNNPFATEHLLRLRYEFRKPDDDGWPALLARLESLHYRAAIVGPHGSGKTTLLEELGRQLRDRGFQTHSVFLNEQDRTYPIDFVRRVQGRLTGNDIVLFDGCEQLGFLNWHRFRRQMRPAGGLVVTTHRPGRLPPLRHCETDPDLLDDLVRRLGGYASLPAQANIRPLYDAHHGNLREALRELYDIAAGSRSLASQEQLPCFSPPQDCPTTLVRPRR